MIDKLKKIKKWKYETCSSCGIRQRLAWAIKDIVWKKVMGTENDVVCLECFLDEADENRIEITKEDFTFLGWIGENINGDILIDKEVEK